MSNFKFYRGDLVLCKFGNDEFKAWIVKLPKPDDQLRIYVIRSYPGGLITHAKESQLTIMKKKDETNKR